MNRSAFATFSSLERNFSRSLWTRVTIWSQAASTTFGSYGFSGPAGFDQPKSWRCSTGSSFVKNSEKPSARSAFVIRKKIGNRMSRRRWMWISFARMFCAFLSCSSGVSSRSDVRGMTTRTPLMGQ